MIQDNYKKGSPVEKSGRTAEEIQLAEAPVWKLLVKFSTPTVLSLLVNSLYNLTDQVFIGQGVGYLGNAATNVTFPLVSITMALALLIGTGCAANFSLSLGQGKRDQAALYAGNALVLQVGVGVVIMVLGLIFLKPLLRLFGTTDMVMPYAIDYGGPILFGLPLVVVTMGVTNLIRADSSPRYAMWSAAMGALLNVVLDPIFIFPWGLNMGVKGAAIATVISQLASFLATIAYIRRFKCITLTRAHLKLRFDAVRRIVSLGASSLLNHVTLTIIQIVVNNSLAYYGARSVYGAEIPLSALGVVMKVQQIMMSTIIGICIGSQPIIGYNYGAGNYARVKKVYRACLIGAFAFGCIGLAVFQLFPRTIISFFGHENELYNQFAVLCFRIYLCMAPLMAFQVCTATYFQSTGRPLKAIELTVIQRLGYMVPCLLILPLFFGIMGLLYSAPTSDILASVVTFIFIARESHRLDSLQMSCPVEADSH